jgi:hypothetical protein
MAKIFSTEKLSINEDSIRIKSSTEGAFEITDAADNVLISRATIEGDVASLNTQDATNKSALEANITSLETVESGNVSDLQDDVASLNTQDATNKSALEANITSLETVESGNVSDLQDDVASLNTQDATNKSALEANITSLETVESGNVSDLQDDVASLNTQDATNKSALEADIASLATEISTNDVYADNATVTQGDSSIAIDYSSVGFASAPAVVGTLRSTGANDPIVGVQLSGAPDTGSATFVFSDSIPSNNYTFDVLASI